MTKELKYVLIAAAVIGTMAAVIVMRTNSINSDDVQPLVVEEELVEPDSTTTEPNPVKDDYATAQKEDDTLAEEEVKTLEKKSAVVPETESKVIAEKVIHSNEKPQMPKAAKVPNSTVKSDRYAVQTAALSTSAAAKAAEAILQSKGFTRAKTVNKGGRFVVYAGTFPDEASAVALKKQLSQKHIDSFIKNIN